MDIVSDLSVAKKACETMLLKDYKIIACVDIRLQPADARVNYKEVCEVIGEALGLSEADMSNRFRYRELVIYRFLCFYILKQLYPDLGTPRIGRIVGGYDHATVINGIKKVKMLLEVNDDYMCQAYSMAIDAVNNLLWCYKNY